MARQHRSAGFTTLELLTALVVLALLALAAVPASRAVISTVDARSARSELAALLTATDALASLDGRQHATVLTTTIHETGRTPQLTASTGPDEVSLAVATAADPAGWAGYAGVARQTRTGRCVLARHQPGASGRPETWTGADPDTCTGRTALAGPDGPPVGEDTDATTMTAPDGLTARRGDRTVTLTWNPVAGAHGYHLYRDGTFTDLTLHPEITVTGLTAGDTAAFTVKAVGDDGASSPTSEPLVIDVRAAGIHDVQLTWTYDGNDVCWDGASTWSYQLLASVPADGDTAGTYRVHLDLVNDGGVEVEGPLLISRTGDHPPDPYGTGLVGTDPTRPDDTRLCAPGGNPDPPFTRVWIVRERTGQTQPIGSTGQDELTAAQTAKQPDGTTPAPPLPLR